MFNFNCIVKRKYDFYIDFEFLIIIILVLFMYFENVNLYGVCELLYIKN